MILDRFEFWRKFLLVVSFVMIIMGLFIAFLNQTIFFDFIFNKNINTVFGLSENSTAGITQFQNWIYGVLGATIVGWGIIMFFVIKYGFREKQKWAWKSIAVGISVWFVIDTSLSIYFGVYFNALFNSILFLLFIIPLLFIKNYFKEVE